ncbi:hypothetical protein R1sor_010432 [Riccia sorocarpa]|uniref:Uncharacterized protein n=1 Tax=Riccia sorocarpa TaxID=122646 RepID=A0ABD3I237_9MARC
MTECHVSEQLPFRSADRKAVRVLQCLQTRSFKTTPIPTVLFQECLTSFLRKQESVRSSSHGTAIPDLDSVVGLCYHDPVVILNEDLARVLVQ